MGCGGTTCGALLAASQRHGSLRWSARRRPSAPDTAIVRWCLRSRPGCRTRSRRWCQPSTGTARTSQGRGARGGRLGDRPARRGDPPLRQTGHARGGPARPPAPQLPRARPDVVARRRRHSRRDRRGRATSRPHAGSRRSSSSAAAIAGRSIWARFASWACGSWVEPSTRETAASSWRATLRGAWRPRMNGSSGSCAGLTFMWIARASRPRCPTRSPSAPSACRERPRRSISAPRASARSSGQRDSAGATRGCTCRCSTRAASPTTRADYVGAGPVRTGPAVPPPAQVELDSTASAPTPARSWTHLALRLAGRQAA